MSVRRLADEAVQPADFAFTKENAAWAKKRMKLYPKGRQQSAVIPLLMRAQEQEGWVTRPAIEEIARLLDMPYIRVLEVATFYTQFQLQPVGTNAHIQMCGTTPCMLRGAEDIRAVCERKIHPEPHNTNEAGTLSWEEVECMGACVNAPMVAIGQDTYEDLTAERFEEIVDAFARGEGDTVPPGPQIERRLSAPVTGQTTLTEVPVNGAARTNDAAAEAASGDALFETPEGEADNLKLISGVGPALEKKLHGLGITQFDQVARLKKADVRKLDDALNFKGRVERDEWVKQAKALAKGGVDEYVRVFGKKPR